MQICILVQYILIVKDFKKDHYKYQIKSAIRYTTLFWSLEYLKNLMILSARLNNIVQFTLFRPNIKVFNFYYVLLVLTWFDV